MADPRDQVDYRGIKQVRVTYPIDNSSLTYESDQAQGTAQAGKAATLNSSQQAALVGDGEGVEGRIELVTKDGYAVLTVGGFVSLPGGESASLTTMKQIVGDLGPGGAKGYIREVDTAVAAELGVARGAIVNPSDPNQVVVRL